MTVLIEEIQEARSQVGQQRDVNFISNILFLSYKII